MRRLVLFAMLLAGALNASAAEPVTTVQVTVAQLEQFLAAQQAAQASDGATAQELRSVELTEQLTESALEREWRRCTDRARKPRLSLKC